eukprot:scpid56035/ scgid34128/ 
MAAVGCCLLLAVPFLICPPRSSVDEAVPSGKIWLHPLVPPQPGTKQPDTMPFLLMLKFDTALRGLSKVSCERYGAIAVFVSIIMANGSTAFIVKGPPIPLFGSGRGDLLSSVPMVLATSVQPPRTQESIAKVTPTSNVKATSTATTEALHNPVEHGSTRDLPMASTNMRHTTDSRWPGERPKNPDPILNPNDEDSMGPVLTGLKPAQTKDTPASPDTNQVPSSTSTAPFVTPTSRLLLGTRPDIPPLVSAHHDSVKWYIFAGGAALLLTIVCVFIICLRVLDIHKHRKMQDLVFQAGLAYPGEDMNGPESYMNIRPCSPLTKEWRSRGFSFGSNSHLHMASGKSTPSGTLLRKKGSGKNDPQGRRRSASSATASIKAKWRSIGKSSGKRWSGGLRQAASTGDIAKDSEMYSPHGFGYQQGNPSYVCDCEMPEQCWESQAGCCERQAKRQVDQRQQQRYPADNSQATVHFNPLHTVCMTPEVQSTPGGHLPRDAGVFMPEDFSSCSAQCPDCSGWVDTSTSDCHHPYGSACDVHYQVADYQCRCGDVQCSRASSALCATEQNSSRTKHLHKNSTLRGMGSHDRRGDDHQGDIAADLLLSMLTQAQNLAKGMSLDRRIPRSVSATTMPHSEASNSSTLARLQDCDESSGYIGSSPGGPSPHTVNDAIVVGTPHKGGATILLPAQAETRQQETNRCDRQGGHDQQRHQQQQQQQQQQQLRSEAGLHRPSRRKLIKGERPADQSSNTALSAPASDPKMKKLSARRKPLNIHIEEAIEESGRRSRLSNHPDSNNGGIADSQSRQSLASAISTRRCVTPNALDSEERRSRSPRPPAPLKISNERPGDAGMHDNEQAQIACYKSLKRRQLGHSGSRKQGSAAPTSQHMRPPVAPKPRLLQKVIPRKESLACLPEQSSSTTEGSAPVHLPDSSQKPLKSSSFWNVPNYGSNERTAPQSHIVTTRSYEPDGERHRPRNGMAIETTFMPIRPALRGQRPTSKSSQEEGMALANPYSQVTLDLPPPPQPSDICMFSDEEQPVGGDDEGYAIHVMMPGLQSAPATKPEHARQDSRIVRSMSNAANATNSTNTNGNHAKLDLSRQNTNSSTEEQKGNFYYLRDGDQILHPDRLDQESHLKLPAVYPQGAGYRRGITGSGLRQVSQLSGDSFEACQTTTL